MAGRKKDDPSKMMRVWEEMLANAIPASPTLKVLEMRACKDCQWWEPKQYQEYCQCKASPPTAIAQPGYAPYAIFPRTKADDWCRAFHPRENGEDVRTVAKPADS